VPKVKLCPSKSVPVTVVINDPDAVNSSTVWLPVLIVGWVLGKNIASKNSDILPDVPALNDAL